MISSLAYMAVRNIQGREPGPLAGAHAFFLGAICFWTALILALYWVAS